MLLTVQFPPLQCYVVPVWLKLFLSILFSKTFSISHPHNLRNQISHQYKTTGKIIVFLHSAIEYLISFVKETVLWVGAYAFGSLLH